MRFGVTYLDWLTGQWIHRSCCTNLEFVKNHVAKSLVVNDANVYVCSKLFSSDARIHRLIAIVIISSSQQLFAEVVYGSILF